MCHVNHNHNTPAPAPNYAPFAATGYPSPLATAGYGAQAQAAPQASIQAVLSLITSLMSPIDSLMGAWQGFGGGNLGLGGYNAAAGYAGAAPTASFAAAGSFGAAPQAYAGGLDLQAAFALSGYNSNAQSYGSLAGAFALSDSPQALYAAAGSAAPTAFAAAAGVGGASAFAGAGAGYPASPFGAYSGAGAGSSNYLLLGLLSALLGMAGVNPEQNPPKGNVDHCKCHC